MACATATGASQRPPSDRIGATEEFVTLRDKVMMTRESSGAVAGAPIRSGSFSQRGAGAANDTRFVGTHAPMGL